MKKKLLIAIPLACLLFLSGVFTGTKLPGRSPKPSIPETDARYFFAEGFFLGSWDGGQWRAAADGGFTLGEVFDQSYPDPWGEPLSAARFFVGEGPGAFDAPEQAASLLAPFGILEGTDFIMALPGRLTGEAAELSIPNSTFYAAFNGQTYQLLSNGALTRPDITADDFALTDTEADALLAEAGITGYGAYRPGYEFWQCDLDGDGQQETVELLFHNQGEDGLPLNSGEPIFYLLAVKDGDSLSVVTSRVTPNTDDMTACFTAAPPIIADLDGDGLCELILHDQGWEWGHYAAFTLTDGGWTECLRAEYGN